MGWGPNSNYFIELSPEIMFVQRNKGTVLICAEHCYHKLKSFKNQSSIWRCSRYKKYKCTGSLTVRGESVLKMRGHTCTELLQNIKRKEIESYQEALKLGQL